ADFPSVEQLKPLAKNFGLRLIVLFGSTARGVMNRESDIDLGVLSEKPLSPVQRRRLWSALSALFPADVDLTVLNHADPLVSYQIASEGVILFETVSFAWETWKSYAMRRYWDTHKFRESQSVYLARRAEELRHAALE
ncbi:MAG: nucleotidyltransferase domain-containing protein, partial [Chloroflexi bacterium]|nr:nucleotidyltransferase domain-containing protein [Chloroflexota bacterium]